MQRTSGTRLSSLYHSTSSAGSRKVLDDRQSEYSVLRSLIPTCSHISWQSSGLLEERLAAVVAVRDIAANAGICSNKQSRGCHSLHVLNKKLAMCNSHSSITRLLFIFPIDIQVISRRSRNNMKRMAIIIMYHIFRHNIHTSF